MERDIFLQFPELNIYPIEVNYKNFDELICFTVIEYLFDNISKLPLEIVRKSTTSIYQP